LRIVVDTNVLISYLIGRNSVPGQAVRKALQGGKLVFTSATFGEFVDVILRDKFDTYATREERLAFIDMIMSRSEFVIISKTITACPDATDNKFLEAAVFGNADYLISGDSDLKDMHPFMGVSIYKAADFVRLAI
jgi:putative PIN family toxin of toxin-antitoxin system